MSGITCHVPCGWYHVSHIPCHLSPIIYHLSLVTCHQSPVTCHLSPVSSVTFVIKNLQKLLIQKTNFLGTQIHKRTTILKRPREGEGVTTNSEQLPVIGLTARARDAPHQSTDKGRSAQVHAKKNSHWEGTYTRTLQLLDQIDPVGRFGEKYMYI